MRASIKSVGSWALLSSWIMATAGCEMWPASETVSPATKQAPPARLAADVLANLGMEELWYAPPPPHSPQEAGIQNAYLLEDGLFIVTRPEVGAQLRYLKKLNRANGHPEWFEEVDGPLDSAPFAYTYPAVVDKPPELFYNILDTVHCLDLRFGDELWNRTLKFAVSTPVVANETHVFIGSDSKRTYAVRKRRQLHDWTYLAGEKFQAAPVLIGSKVIVASHDSSVYGLDPLRGWIYPGSWSRDTGARVVADMATYDSWVFVGSTDYKLYCLESANGAVVWDFVAGAPIVDPPVVYRYRANREFVYCVAAGGSRRNRHRTLFAIPLPKGGIAPRGDPVWRVEGVRKVVSMGKDTLYVIKEPGPTGKRVIAGLDVLTGKEKFELPVEGFHLVPTNHADNGRNRTERGRIYLVSSTGAIQAIGEKL